MIDELEWKATPPPGVSYQTHKFSIIDVIEVVSMRLNTDYTKQVESIVTGAKGRVVFSTLPHMILEEGENGLLKEVNGKALIGRLGRRQVLFDRSKEMFQKITITNGIE